MKVLIIQENGRHDKNRHLRECFSLQRSFTILGHEAIVWGLGHPNFNEKITFKDFDLIINLENYDEIGWVPDLSNIKTKKLLWSIDAHVRGEHFYNTEFERGGYDLLLHSTKDYVNSNKKLWFPNCFDDNFVKPMDVEKTSDVGFCGSLLNRSEYIKILSENFNFRFDNFVIGDDMIKSINSYRIHWNKNISNDINYRSFETIGCGIPLVTNYNYQYEELGFVDGFNVMLYRNMDEMVRKIQSLLSDEHLMMSMANNGLELSKKHTYTERVKKILEIYSNL
jgi:hypothetical protein